MQLKIGTLNLCLGLPNKKIVIKNIINEEQIDILCLQETELEINLHHNLMSFPGYIYESEMNKTQSRVGCYVKSNISYVRRIDLEGQDSHLIILDIKAKNNKHIINIYRPFNPQNNVRPLEFFKFQIDLIHSAYNYDTILMGDINLDWNKKGNHNYHFKNYFNYMEERMGEQNLIQLVNFPTWSRVVNDVFGNQLLIMFTHQNQPLS